MGLWGRLGKAREESMLQFDNYPFKLAVIQELMYEQSLLGKPYQGAEIGILSDTQMSLRCQRKSPSAVWSHTSSRPISFSGT